MYDRKIYPRTPYKDNHRSNNYNRSYSGFGQQRPPYYENRGYGSNYTGYGNGVNSNPSYNSQGPIMGANTFTYIMIIVVLEVALGLLSSLLMTTGVGFLVSIAVAIRWIIFLSLAIGLIFVAFKFPSVAKIWKKDFQEFKGDNSEKNQEPRDAQVEEAMELRQRLSELEKIEKDLDLKRETRTRVEKDTEEYTKQLVRNSESELLKKSLAELKYTEEALDKTREELFLLRKLSSEKELLELKTVSNNADDLAAMDEEIKVCEEIKEDKISGYEAKTGIKYLPKKTVQEVAEANMSDWSRDSKNFDEAQELRMEVIMMASEFPNEPDCIEVISNIRTYTLEELDILKEELTKLVNDNKLNA